MQTIPWDAAFEVANVKLFEIHRRDLTSGGYTRFRDLTIRARNENNARRMSEWYPELQKLHDEVILSGSVQ